MLLFEFIYELCLLKDSSSLRKVCLTTNLVEHFPSALTDKEGHRGENYHISEPAPTRLILDGMGWRGEESRNTDRAAPGLPHAPKSTRRVSSLLSVAPTPRRQSLKNSAMARGVRLNALHPPPRRRRYPVSKLRVCHAQELNIVVQRELVRMRSLPYRLHLILHLVIYPGLDQLLGKDITLHQEVVVSFKRVQRFLKRSGKRRHLGEILGTEIIDILIERFPRVDLILDPIKSGHEHCGKGKVGIARRIGRTELQALGFRAC